MLLWSLTQHLEVQTLSNGHGARLVATFINGKTHQLAFPVMSLRSLEKLIVAYGGADPEPVAPLPSTPRSVTGADKPTKVFAVSTAADASPDQARPVRLTDARRHSEASSGRVSSPKALHVPS
jgi:hypothetical protein